jgi:hypothetical protein
MRLWSLSELFFLVGKYELVLFQVWVTNCRARVWYVLRWAVNSVVYVQQSHNYDHPARIDTTTDLRPTLMQKPKLGSVWRKFNPTRHLSVRKRKIVYSCLRTPCSTTLSLWYLEEALTILALLRPLSQPLEYGMIPHCVWWVLAFWLVTLLPPELLAFECGLKYVALLPRGLCGNSLTGLHFT